MTTSVKFGPRNGIDSKDYIPYMQGPDGPTSKPVSLLGHSFTAPNSNLTDAVTFTDVEIYKGQVRTVSRVKRAAYETSRTYTIGFPSSLWTPAMERANNTGCKTTFFLKYNCAEDPIYNHFDVFPDATMNPPVEAEDIVTNGDETNIITATSEIQVPKKLRGWALGYEVIYDAGTAAINAIAFRTAECEMCSEAGALALVAVGGNGTAAPAVWSTKDRFSSVTTPALTGSTAGDVAKAVWTRGDNIVVSTYTGLSLTAATAGGLYVSVDGGATFSKISNVTDVIADIFEASGMLFAIGKNSTGSAVIWTSDNNGQSWTSVTSTALPASTILKSGSYDPETGRLYFVGGTKLLVGKMIGMSLTLSDISSSLPTTVSSLNRVLVIGGGELVIGGDSGYLVTSRDSANTFIRLSVGSANITGIAGNQYRLVVAAGNTLYERTIMTDNDFRRINLQNGQTITGNYNHVVMAPDDDFNRYAAVTTSGEVVFGKPFYPNA